MKMKIKEFESVLHMPHKLKQIIVNGVEKPQTLPPLSSRNAYPVDSYPSCPDNWMNGSDIASSYFVGVENEKGMWLDFNSCCQLSKDVAIVISIQGINPITGQKTDTLRLEQYKNKCPVHNIDFQQNNYCKKCNFDWPDQNYISTTGTPTGNFWLDGFRRPDGTVRQYIFTEEEMKGIANQIIGKDKVYAIGIAFYYSKEKKKDDYVSMHFRGSIPDKISTLDVSNNKTWYAGDKTWYAGDKMSHLVSYSSQLDTECANMNCLNISSAHSEESVNLDSFRSAKSLQPSVIKTVKPVKNLDIGAGALINQKIYRDSESIDYWENEPAGMLYINYCDMKTLEQILNSGKIQKKSEGFMDKLSIGS